MMKAFSVWLLAVLCAVALAVSHGSADETAPVEIYTPEDMLRIAENPDGSYILMCDLDLSSVEWPAFTFRGTFDGNDHMLINLRFGDVSSETQVTYDGNRKTYDTHFAGLFAILDHACVKNVRLPGLTLSKTYEGDCFLGGIAGYANESTIENCEISGTVSLDVTGRMFGVGGVLGYGNAVIRNCKVDVTLINTDLDAAHRDEEFLGGICAAGYPDIDACEITLAGFLSDHGYVHSGGLVGMYIVYPKAFSRNGFITNNTLAGFITFFEDNTNRRAYCKESCGEVMDWLFKDSGNKYSFKRDERKKYDVNLLPHGDCANPVFTENTVAPSCTEPGYTEHTCASCGYSYRDDYKLTVHTPGSEYETLDAPTLETPGLGLFTCELCGAKIRQELPMLTPTPTPTPLPTVTPEPPVTDTPSDSDAEGSGGNALLYLLPIIIGLPLGVIAGLWNRNRRRKRTR